MNDYLTVYNRICASDSFFTTPHLHPSKFDVSRGYLKGPAITIGVKKNRHISIGIQ